MKILSTGNFYGEHQKFLELLGTVKLLKPEVLIITGNMLPPINTEHDLPNQLSFIENYVNYLDKYSKYCQYILYISGDKESVLSYNKLKAILEDKLKMVHSINEESFKFKNYHFIGMPYVPNYKENKLKDWVGIDNPNLNIIDDKIIYTENEKLKSIEYNEFYIMNKPNIDIVLDYKIKKINKKENEHLILVTQVTPFLVDKTNYTLYSNAIGNRLDEFKYIFCVNEIDNNLFNKRWLMEENKTKILNSSQIKNILCYCYLINVNDKEYFYHPLERNVSVLLENILNYKSILDNQDIEINGLGDSVAKFLHTGVVGKLVEKITGKSEPCLDCKRRQELLNNILPFNN